MGLNLNKEKTIYDTLNEGLTDVLTTMSGVDSDKNIKIVDNILAFIGVAGGAGTSTLVANFAQLAEMKGLSVLVIDMNILYPAQNILFRIEYKDKQPDLVSFLTGENEIGECLVSKKKSSKISILSAHDRQLIDYINCDNDIASKNLEAALGKIKYLFDLILIDCPNAMDYDPVSSVLYRSDAYYVIWDESVGCVVNFDSFTKLLNNIGLNTNRLKAIMNKKTGIYYPKSTFKSLHLELLGTLPYEVSVIESSLKGELYVKKGASFSKNAKHFISELNVILDKLLELGGYGRETDVEKIKQQLNSPKIIDELDNSGQEKTM